MSATGSGNTKCMLGIARASGTVPSGGTAVTYTKMCRENATVSMDIRKNNAGLTVGGTVIDPYFTEIAIRTGSDGHVFDYTFDDLGLVLSPGIVILADGDLITGASLHGHIEFALNP